MPVPDIYAFPLFGHYVLGLPVLLLAVAVNAVCLFICFRRPSLRLALVNALVAVGVVNVLVFLFCVVLGTGTWFADIDSALVTTEKFVVAGSAGVTMVCSVVYAIALWDSRPR